MKKQLELICKHNRAVQRIAEDKSANRLSHCYLLTASSEREVKPILMATAINILCKNNACFNCNICNSIIDGNMYDMKIIDIYNAKKTEQKDLISDLINDTSFTAINASSIKLYLIIGADRLDVLYQNKLLKTLEEPNENIVIILGVTNEAKVLGTIRSRALKLDCGVIEEDAIKNFLYENNKSATESEIELAIALSGGSISNAEEILSNKDSIIPYNDTMQLLIDMRMSSDVVKYVGSSILQEDQLIKTLALLELIFRDIMVVNTGELALVRVKSELKRYKQLAERYSIAACVKCIEKVNLAKRNVNAYCSKTAVVDTLLLNILEVRYKCSKS